MVSGCRGGAGEAAAEATEETRCWGVTLAMQAEADSREPECGQVADRKSSTAID